GRHLGAGAGAGTAPRCAGPGPRPLERRRLLATPGRRPLAHRGPRISDLGRELGAAAAREQLSRSEGLAAPPTGRAAAPDLPAVGAAEPGWGRSVVLGAEDDLVPAGHRG